MRDLARDFIKFMLIAITGFSGVFASDFSSVIDQNKKNCGGYYNSCFLSKTALNSRAYPLYITFIFIFFLNKQIEKQNIHEAVEEVKKGVIYQRGLKVLKQQEERDDKQHELKMIADNLEIDKIKKERERINSNSLSLKRIMASIRQFFR